MVRRSCHCQLGHLKEGREKLMAGDSESSDGDEALQFTGESADGQRTRVLLTGGTSGIGLRILRLLVRSGHEVHVLTRQHRVLASLLADMDHCGCYAVPALSPSMLVTGLDFDLGDIARMRDLHDELVAGKADQFKRPYDIVICNAALMHPQLTTPRLTADSSSHEHPLDETFLCNVLGHYLLLCGVLAGRPDGHSVRVVVLTTGAAKIFGTDTGILGWLINLFTATVPRSAAALDGYFAFRHDSGFLQYFRSKAACVLLAQIFASESATTALAVHPGNARTPIVARASGFFFRFIKLFGRFFVSKTKECATRVTVAARMEAPPKDSWLCAGIIKPLPPLYCDYSVINNFRQFCHRHAFGED